MKKNVLGICLVVGVWSCIASADANLKYYRTVPFAVGEKAVKNRTLNTVSGLEQSYGLIKPSGGPAVHLGVFSNSAVVLNPGDLLETLTAGVLSGGYYVADAKVTTKAIVLEVSSPSNPVCIPTEVDIAFTATRDPACDGSSICAYEARFGSSVPLASTCDSLGNSYFDSSSIDSNSPQLLFDADTTPSSGTYNVGCFRLVNNTTSPTATSRWVKTYDSYDGTTVSCGAGIE